MICTGFLFPKFSLMSLELIHAAVFSRFPGGYEFYSHMNWGQQTKHLLVLDYIGFISGGNQTPIGEDLLKTPVLRLAQLREKGSGTGNSSSTMLVR